MAHFAELDKNNVVLRVLVTSNDEPDEGHLWLVESLGGTWVKTSYNRNIRKNFAGIGFVFDDERDAFIPPRPFASWVLDEETCQWDPPVAYPTDGLTYSWNETELAWQIVDFSETPAE
jgi:hypothetical protein